MPAGRIRGVAAAIATLAIVALIAGLLLRFSAGRPATLHPSAHAAATHTHTPAPPPLHLLGSWSAVPALANQLDFPIIAPSDPRVVYEAYLTAGTTATGGGVPQPITVLRRSDDDGASWHRLPAPTLPGNYIDAMSLEINPGVASNLFVEGMFASNPNDATVCTLPQAAAPLSTTPYLGTLGPISKYYGCRLDYYSSDGGADWHPLSLPTPGPWLLAGDPWPTDLIHTQLGQFQAQGDRLYTVIYTGTAGPDPAGLRVLASGDLGATWAFADGGLLRPQQNICQFVALPTVPTLFAVTSTAGCFSETTSVRQLWRSDDRGAHWASAGPLTDRRAFLVATAASAIATQPLLYAVQVGPDDPMTGPPTPLLSDVRASTDGGHTWLPAPRATISAGSGLFQFAGITPAGALLAAEASPTLTLANGAPSTVTLYAWRPGNAGWTQASLPSAATGAPQFIFAATPQSASALWLVTAANQTDPANQGDAIQRFTSAGR